MLAVSQMKVVDISQNNTNTSTYTSSTARALNSKHNSPEVKDVCYFAERVR